MSRTAFPLRSVSYLAGAVIAVACAAAALAQPTDAILLGLRVHPESIAAVPGGGLLIGGIGTGGVYRAAPNATEATLLASIADAFPGGGTIAGVFATADTAWACGNGPFNAGLTPILFSFDLATGAQTGAYVFPVATGFCNDIAVGPDGTVYVSSTSFDGVNPGRLLYLAPGAGAQLTVALESAAIAGINGIAFVENTLYATNVATAQLMRIDFGPAMAASAVVLTTSLPMMGPDGLRTTADGAALLVADNRTGQVLRVTVSGDQATARAVIEGTTGATSAVEAGGMLYWVEPDFNNLFNPAGRTEPFFVKAAPLAM